MISSLVYLTHPVYGRNSARSHLHLYLHLHFFPFPHLASMYRIGQTRPVTVKRFIIKDSIEERILSTRRCGPSTDRPQDLPRIDGADTIADERSLPEHYDDINDIDDDDNDDSERQPQQSPSKRARRTLDLQGQLEALFGYSTTAVARAGKS